MKCICGSQYEAELCCLAVINGEQTALTAETLMRARFTAYTQANEAYVLKTWHVSTRPLSVEMDVSMKWTHLSVVCASKQQLVAQVKTASVEFVASFSKHGGIEQMHELSQFIYENKEWYYVDGEQLESQPLGHYLGRNDDCYCGSGKKYKKCCL